MKDKGNFMNNWKAKLFGDNAMNFYGWVVIGPLVIGLSVWFVVQAIQAGATRSPECLLLVALWFMVAGHFCLALQNYSARVAQTIEVADEKNHSKDSQGK
jgi:hypothetical protein